MAWIVKGSTGEYSDYMEWDVVVYYQKEAAELHANFANDWLKQNGIYQDQIKVDYYKFDKTNPWDKGMSVDYTGVLYTIDELKIRKIVREME